MFVQVKFGFALWYNLNNFNHKRVNWLLNIEQWVLTSVWSATEVMFCERYIYLFGRSRFKGNWRDIKFVAVFKKVATNARYLVRAIKRWCECTV